MTALIVLFSALSMGFAIVYAVLMRGGGSVRALFAKGTASFFFFVTGLFCALAFSFETYDMLVLSGLFFGMVADIVFGARFVAKKKPARFFISGAILFSIGHGLYIAAFNVLHPVPLYWYLAAAALGILVFLGGKRALKMHYGKLAALVLCYCLIVSAMLFSAIGATPAFAPRFRLLLAVAAALFSFSDLVLLYSTFIKNTTVLHFLNLCPYYAGQLLFALSMIWI